MGACAGVCTCSVGMCVGVSCLRVCVCVSVWRVGVCLGVACVGGALCVVCGWCKPFCVKFYIFCVWLM